MAIQNLLWGIGVPLAGMIADRRGSTSVLVFGALPTGPEFTVWRRRRAA